MVPRHLADERRGEAWPQETGQDDMTEGDLGDGLGRRPGGIYEVQVSHLFKSRKRSDENCSPPSLPRKGEARRGDPRQCSQHHSRQDTATYPDESRISWTLCRCQRSPDSNSELSNVELRHRLHETLEEVEILKTELEAFQRQLEGKEEALKILQSMAVLDKATSHTQAVLQKTIEQKRSLEKEVNALQWEIEFDHNRFKNIEESWTQKHDRLNCENAVLKETLKVKTEEVKMLKAENAILNQHYLETLTMLDIAQLKTAEESTRRGLSGLTEASSLELTVLGACLCHGPGGGPCSCAEIAVSTQKTLLQLRQELWLSQKSREEAHMMADAFRIAFEQQLMRKNEQTLKWTQMDKICEKATKWINWKNLQDDGLTSPRNKKTFRQKLLSLFSTDNSSKKTKDQDNPQEDLKMLVDLLNDKEAALAHQRKVSYMLARALEAKNSASKENEEESSRKENFSFKTSWQETSDFCILPDPIHSSVPIFNSTACICSIQHLHSGQNYPRTLKRSCSLPSSIVF